jgi:hypothetical protein
MMTYKAWSEAMAEYRTVISKKKSLQMIIRMNRLWITGNNPRSQKRKKIIKECEEKLAKLVIPPKPKQPLGIQVEEPNGTYIGFFNTDNIEVVKEKLAEAGYTNYKLKKKPRWND